MREQDLVDCHRALSEKQARLAAAERVVEAARAVHGFAGLTTKVEQGYTESLDLLRALGKALDGYENLNSAKQEDE